MTLHIMPDGELFERGWKVEQRDDRTEPYFVYSKGEHHALNHFTAWQVEDHGEVLVDADYLGPSWQILLEVPTDGV